MGEYDRWYPISQVLSLCRNFISYVCRDFVTFKWHITPILVLLSQPCLKRSHHLLLLTQQHTSFLHSKSAWKRSEWSRRLVWYGFFCSFYLVWSSIVFELQMTIWQKKLKIKISPLIFHCFWFSVVNGRNIFLSNSSSFYNVNCLFQEFSLTFILLVQRSLISRRVFGCCC